MQIGSPEYFFLNISVNISLKFLAYCLNIFGITFLYILVFILHWYSWNISFLHIGCMSVAYYLLRIWSLHCCTIFAVILQMFCLHGIKICLTVLTLLMASIHNVHRWSAVAAGQVKFSQNRPKLVFETGFYTLHRELRSILSKLGLYTEIIMVRCTQLLL